MPNSSEQVLSMYRDDRKERSEHHAVKGMIASIDEAMGGDHAFLESEREGERVRLTMTLRVPWRAGVVDASFREDPPRVAQEVRRQYREAGFHDVKFEPESGGVIVRLIVYDDSEEKPEERAVRLLSESLRMAGIEAAKRPPELPQDERMGPGEG
jgi:hypothetical protein